MTHPAKHGRGLLPALLILLASLASRPALANNCTWNGGANGDWGTAANWNTCGGTTPGSGDTVSIPNVGSPPNVFTGTTATIGALTLQTAAVLTVNGGSLTLNAGMTGPGSLGVGNAGTLGWTGGVIDGAGPVTFQPGTFFNLSGGAKTLGKSLTLPGTTVLTGAADLTLSPGVVIQNLGTLDIQGDGGIFGAGTLIVNSGTLLRTTSGSNPGIQADVNNNGSIQVTTGGLTFTGNTSNAGTVDASAASLYYDAGTHTFDNQVMAGHIIISAGNLSFNGPTTVFVGFVEGGAGTVVHAHTTFTSANQTELDGGHFFVDPSSAVTVLGSLVVASGATLTMSANVPVAATSLNQLGTIEGNQDLNVSGGTFWIGGIQLGPGFTRLMGTTTIGGTAVDVGRGLDLYGTTTWTGGGIGMTSPASLIRVIGALSIDTSFTGLTGGGGKLMILGSGSLSTPGGSSPLTIDVPVSNAGAVTLNDRPTTLAGYSQSSGSTSLQRLTYPLTVSQPVQITGGNLSGFGTLIGDLTISGSGSVSPGNIPGNPGTITVTGNYTQSAPVALLTDSIATIPGFTDFVGVGGTATLGGPLNLSISFAPANGNVLSLMSYSKRLGSFGPLTLPALPAGLGWAPRYAANGFSLIVQSLLPAVPLRVDQQPASAGVHNVNGVLDPGERVLVAPTWSNAAATSTAFTGTLSNITGPAGATYTIAKNNADYGSLLPTHSVDCFMATGNCYEISVDNPPTRPAAHWDATVDETASNGSVASWTFHIGGSFNDVAPTVPQYRFVETLFHNQITGGCGGGGFCPSSSVTRAQMAVFLLKSKFGPSYIPPPVAGGVFFDLPSNGFAPYIETLGNLGIASGCGNNNFCPNDLATRAQMAVFLLRTEGGPSYVPPDCVTPTFLDVPCANGFSKWIEELARRGITAGCGNNNFCPGLAVTRGQMAVFLTVTFGLGLNGV